MPDTELEYGKGKLIEICETPNVGLLGGIPSPIEGPAPLYHEHSIT